MMALTPYVCPLTTVPSFKYMGRILSALDYYWLSVVHNISKERKKWVPLFLLLLREGADDRTSGIFYIRVVKLVLLYGLETWVISTHIGRAPVGFHHRVVCRLTGYQPRSRMDGTWFYPLLEE